MENGAWYFLGVTKKQPSVPSGYIYSKIDLIQYNYICSLIYSKVCHIYDIIGNKCSIIHKDYICFILRYYTVPNGLFWGAIIENRHGTFGVTKN